MTKNSNDENGGSLMLWGTLNCYLMKQQKPPQHLIQKYWTDKNEIASSNTLRMANFCNTYLYNIGSDMASNVHALLSIPNETYDL